MSAIEELGEVVKVKDAAARALAFARWCSRWILQGYVESRSDAAIVTSAKDRSRIDSDAIHQVLNVMLAHHAHELLRVEDRGLQETTDEQGRPFKAWATRIEITFLRSKPHDQDAEVEPGRMLQ